MICLKIVLSFLDIPPFISFLFLDFLRRLDFNLHLCYIASLLLDIPDLTYQGIYRKSWYSVTILCM